MKRLFTTGALAALAGCASTAIPTYVDVGIRLSGSVDGRLDRIGRCIVVTRNRGHVVPIWPHGTRVGAQSVTLPAANGGATLTFRRNVRLLGGVFGISSDRDVAAFSNGHRARACGSTGFLVNTGSAAP